MITTQEKTWIAFREMFVSAVVLAIFCLALGVLGGNAQTSGNSSLSGVVADPTGAVVPGATVEIHNPVSQFSRSTTTDGAGRFSFPNVPFNVYHLSVTLTGFAAHSQDIDVRSAVPLSLKVTLQIAGAAESITVQGEASDLLENDPTFHTDVDRSLFDKLPLESSSSAAEFAGDAVIARSCGRFQRPLPRDGRSRFEFLFFGWPADNGPAEQGVLQPDSARRGAIHDSHWRRSTCRIRRQDQPGDRRDHALGPRFDDSARRRYASYGTFGNSNVDFNFSYGGKNWGNFIAANGLDSGRFLDPPEFVVFHDHGNEENVFDRFDYQFSQADALHFNLGFTRSWFQTPNSYDNLNYGVLGPDGNFVGPTDQRSKILTFNIAPTWSHTISPNAVLNVTGYVRRDAFNYYPSNNPFADFSPIQQETVAQQRTLLNAGALANVTYTKGIHNIKAGVMYEQTFLNENDQLGIVDPTLNSPCVDMTGSPVPGFISPSQCAAAGLQPNGGFNPLLSCYDLTRPVPSPSSGCQSQHSTLFPFMGHTDVKELAMYVQDTITKRNWTFNLGIRGDLYNGLSVARQAEPRVGIAYDVQKTNTVLRASYARTMETPFNENLVLSSTGCLSPVIAALVPCVPAVLTPGHRNEFHVGLQQAFGRFLVVDAEYIWKYTHTGYDFSILGNTPIFFPIGWTSSKIPGFALRASVPVYHGFSALVVMSSVAARFFPPQVGGLGVTVGQSGFPFRIDHDEAYNMTAHMQYQTPWKRGPWLGFNWRYDSGLVAGAVPCYGILPFNNCPTSTTLNGQPAVDLSGLSADEEFQAGLTCNGVHATPFTPLPTPCPASQYGSTLVKIPAPNTQNDDHNPARIASRSLFDLAIGDDNLFMGDKYKWSLQFTAINLTNNYALYNFLSTFSGTHYVTPRALTVQLGFHF